MTKQPEDWDAIHAAEEFLALPIPERIKAISFPSDPWYDYPIDHAAMAEDLGDDWRDCHAFIRLADAKPTLFRVGFAGMAEDLLEAMHDRDGLHAERDMWREECLQMTAAALS